MNYLLLEKLSAGSSERAIRCVIFPVVGIIVSIHRGFKLTCGSMYTVLSVVKKNGLAWSLLAVSLSAQVVPPRLPRKTPPSTAAIQGIVRNLAGLGLGGVSVTIRETSREQAFNTITSGDGVYRLLDVPPGAYQLKVDSPGFEPFERADIRLEAGEVFDLDITLKDLPGDPEGPRRVV